MKETTRVDIAGDWATVEAQLPKGWRRIAEEQGLVHLDYPAYMGTKVTDIAQALRLILYYVATNTSLATAAAMGAAGGIVDMSSVALHKWMRKIGTYLSTLLALMTEAETTFAPEKWAGYDIILVDGSSVSRPGAKGTTARIHYGIRLTTLRPVHIEVTDETGGETFRRFEAEPGQLWMGDRGYANPPGVAKITRTGADVLVRYNRGSLPLYDIEGHLLDVRGKLERLKKPWQAKEWFAAVRTQDGEVVRGRLCATKLPADKAAEARTRLRREQGADVTQESLDAAAYVVVFTTVPRARLTADLILELYRLRWQVELHIKRDKSISGLDRLPNFRADTIHSWLCAKLLLTQIARKLATPLVAIPPSAADVDRRDTSPAQIAQGPAAEAKARHRTTVASYDGPLAVSLRRTSSHCPS
jgi:hypothetical protein